MRSVIAVVVSCTAVIVGCSTQVSPVDAPSPGDAKTQAAQLRAEEIYSQVTSTDDGKPTLPDGFTHIDPGSGSIDDMAAEYSRAKLGGPGGETIGNSGPSGPVVTPDLPDFCIGKGGWVSVCCYHFASGTGICCTYYNGSTVADGCG